MKSLSLIVSVGILLSVAQSWSNPQVDVDFANLIKKEKITFHQNGNSFIAKENNPIDFIDVDFDCIITINISKLVDAIPEERINPLQFYIWDSRELSNTGTGTDARFLLPLSPDTTTEESIIYKLKKEEMIKRYGLYYDSQMSTPDIYLQISDGSQYYWRIKLISSSVRNILDLIKKDSIGIKLTNKTSKKSQYIPIINHTECQSILSNSDLMFVSTTNSTFTVSIQSASGVLIQPLNRMQSDAGAIYNNLKKYGIGEAIISIPMQNGLTFTRKFTLCAQESNPIKSFDELVISGLPQGNSSQEVVDAETAISIIGRNDTTGRNPSVKFYAWTGTNIDNGNDLKEFQDKLIADVNISNQGFNTSGLLTLLKDKNSDYSKKIAGLLREGKTVHFILILADNEIPVAKRSFNVQMKGRSTLARGLREAVQISYGSNNPFPTVDGKMILEERISLIIKFLKSEKFPDNFDGAELNYMIGLNGQNNIETGTFSIGKEQILSLSAQEGVYSLKITYGPANDILFQTSFIAIAYPRFYLQQILNEGSDTIRIELQDQIEANKNRRTFDINENVELYAEDSKGQRLSLHPDFDERFKFTIRNIDDDAQSASEPKPISELSSFLNTVTNRNEWDQYELIIQLENSNANKENIARFRFVSSKTDWLTFNNVTAGAGYWFKSTDNLPITPSISYAIRFGAVKPINRFWRDLLLVPGIQVIWQEETDTQKRAIGIGLQNTMLLGLLNIGTGIKNSKFYGYVGIDVITILKGINFALLENSYGW